MKIKEGINIRKVLSLEDIRACNFGCNVQINKDKGILVGKDLAGDTCEVVLIHPCQKEKIPLVTRYFIVEGEKTPLSVETKELPRLNQIYDLVQEQFNKMFERYPVL